MRSKLAPVFVGLGVFLIVAAALVRFYAYPTLADVPPDYEGITRLEAKDAQIVDWDSLVEPGPARTETRDLSISSRTIADSGVDAPGDTVVWVNSTVVGIDGGDDFQRTQERAAFDGKTGAAVACKVCKSWTKEENTDVPVERKGQVYKFPFGTEKKDYLVWDGTLGKATEARFEGEERIDGLSVYKFVQTIAPTVVDTRSLPADKFGLSAQGPVDAQLWYGMTRTFYVEPETGSPVNRVEERMQELRYDGSVIPVFNAKVQYTQAQVDELVDDAKGNARMLGGMKVVFPLVLLLFGAALVAGGLVIGRSARPDGERPARPRDQELAGV